MYRQDIANSALIPRPHFPAVISQEIFALGNLKDKAGSGRP